MTTITLPASESPADHPPVAIAGLPDEPAPRFPMVRWFLLFALIVVGGVGAAGLVTVSTDAVADATATLAIVGLVAVGIERALEAAWTVVDSTQGAWWPFNLVHDQIESRVKGFANLIQPYLDSVKWAATDLRELKKDDPRWPDNEREIVGTVDAIPGQLEAIATRLAVAKYPNDQRLAYLLNHTSVQINAVLARYPDLKQKLGADTDLAATIVNDVNAFMDSFKDNPARRMISLVVGALAGFVVAVGLRLDLFAALGVHPWQNVLVLDHPWALGVPLTGIVMGLGSSPTHELIQAIQQFKQSSSQQSKQTNA